MQKQPIFFCILRISMSLVYLLNGIVLVAYIPLVQIFRLSKNICGLKVVIHQTGSQLNFKQTNRIFSFFASLIFHFDHIDPWIWLLWYVLWRNGIFIYYRFHIKKIFITIITFLSPTIPRCKWFHFSCSCFFLCFFSPPFLLVEI